MTNIPEGIATKSFPLNPNFRLMMEHEEQDYVSAYNLKYDYIVNYNVYYKCQHFIVRISINMN